jgi:hypothetical protein
MRALLDNARRVFEVAEAAADAGSQDFALLIQPNGGLHLVMESEFSIESAAQDVGAVCAFRVTRSAAGVRVEAQGFGSRCVLENRAPLAELLRDRPLYWVSGLPLSSGSARESAGAV